MNARLQLKIALDHVKPAVWRRVVVDDSLTFRQLHAVIQRAMGWEDCHLHEFIIGDRELRIGTKQAPGAGFGFGDDDEVLSEEKTRLAEVLADCKKFRYWYDFGDDWMHTVSVEKRLPPDPQAAPAELVAGKNACPPEDCGGPWGYGALRAALADPSHPEHAEMAEWYEGFDPTGFDLAERARHVAGAVRRGARTRQPAKAK